MPRGLHVRYLSWFHFKKYASLVCLKDLNGSGELPGRGPFRTGAGKTVREENRFHYREYKVGKSKGRRDDLDHFRRICYYHFCPVLLNC